MYSQVRPLNFTLLLKAALLALLLAGAHAVADDDPVCPSCNMFPGTPAPQPPAPPPPDAAADAVGTWQLLVQFPDMPPFLEFITFHYGGTLTETNTSLHGNSANPFFPFNGNDGFGLWQDNGDGTISFAFKKMMFEAEQNEFIGFLRVKGSAIVEDGIWEDVESNTSIITPDGFVIEDFGQALVTGARMDLETIN